MYKLLLVEDEDLVRNGIKRFVSFSELNIEEIYEAANGEEGLRLFQEHQPDLVLLDINMPRMNGLDFAAKVKAIKPSVKMAVITGYDYYDYAVTALKLGINDYVLKPVSRNDVFEVLNKLVGALKQEGQQSELLALLQDFQMKAEPDKTSAYSDDEQKQIMRIIEENLANPRFSLTVLAGQMGFSAGYMSTLFKKLFKVSFQDYLVSWRLEHAKLLLLASDKKVYEISEDVGFDNPNYFSATFKKKFGISPLHYRDQVKET
ncbi:DNA-binding response regulator [Pullulanibacillus camelliae]|uniref:DNA-binding response regulator n=1 Tax=Pullulanibacillus camelliae TaxID=1707096 RepID=A0A8J2VMP3_9BACL|nr:response regulator [Pullulanibacillus camelliae]GGE31014.1 DNA-binding response regulator [Pullulanibacillus camelliae]